jgi:hypothetical protein
MQSFAVFLIIATAAACARGQTLSLEAHETGTGDAQISRWETEWGSYDRDFSRSKIIRVKLRNISRKPAPFAITVYFVAKATVPPSAVGYDPRHLFIYDRAEYAGEFHNEIELPTQPTPGPFEFRSHKLDANVQHYQLAGVEYASGDDMIGWIVVGRSNGEIFGIAASSQELLQLAGGHGSQSFEEMIAEYERHHPSTLTKKDVESVQPAAASPPKAQAGVNSSPPTQLSSAPSEQMITLTRPVEVNITYGKAKLPAGLKLKVLSRSGATINAVYLGDTVVIPVDAAAPR